MAIKHGKMNPQFLNRLYIVMFGIQLFGVVSRFLAFSFFLLFGGAFDLIGDYPGFNETCIILPFSLLLTLIGLGTYRRLRNRILSIGLLISTMILNAVLVVQVILVWYTLGPWLIMLSKNF